MTFKQTLLQPFRDLQTMWNDSVRDYREALDGDFAPMVKATVITLLVATLLTFLGMFFLLENAYIIFFVFCGFIFLAWCVFALHKVWQRFFAKAKIGYTFARNNLNYGGYVYWRYRAKRAFFYTELAVKTLLFGPRDRNERESYKTWFKTIAPLHQFNITKYHFLINQAEIEVLAEVNTDMLDDREYERYKKDCADIQRELDGNMRKMRKIAKEIN